MVYCCCELFFFYFYLVYDPFEEGSSILQEVIDLGSASTLLEYYRGDDSCIGPSFNSKAMYSASSKLVVAYLTFDSSLFNQINIKYYID